MTDNQTPTLRVCPQYERTLGDAAFEFGRSFGITLDPWQRNVIDDWLAIGDDGKWAAGTCGLSVPRQNGKTALVKVRCMLGIFSLGETILFTCHEVRTSRQVFDSLAEILNPMGEFPDLAAQVQYIKRSNGYEEIKVADWVDDEGTWHKGGKLLFSSRSKGASRGFTADVVVADESMYMTDEQVAALVPTMASASGGDMQFIMLGTPPSPGDNGTVFNATRESAMNGATGVSWNEWSVDEIGDTHDWSRVERCNPSFGTRLMRKAVESEMSVMAPDCFARERLGWWSVQQVNAAIPAKAWERCATKTPPMDGVVSYGVKFSADGSLGCISACAKPTDVDTPPHIELVEARNMGSGLRWFADWLEPRSKDCACIVIDGVAHAQPLIEELASRNVKRVVVKPRSGDVSAACSKLLNAVNEGAVTHFDQPSMNDSALNSTKRSIGNWGGWGFGGDNAAIVESAALAYWGAMTSKRKPGRKLRIG